MTLRGARMWEFFDRLISLAIPRIRDFRGLPANSFDGRGNYTFGVTEQLIFPEIDYDRIDTTRGMDITIVTTARTDEEGKALLAAFGFPFRTADIGDDQQERKRKSQRDRRVDSRRARGSKRWRRRLWSRSSSAPRSTRCAGYTRCRRCGRPRAVFRKFGLCRICLREMVARRRSARRHEGQLVRGVTAATDDDD